MASGAPGRNLVNFRLLVLRNISLGEDEFYTATLIVGGEVGWKSESSVGHDILSRLVPMRLVWYAGADRQNAHFLKSASTLLLTSLKGLKVSSHSSNMNDFRESRIPSE